MTTTPTNKPITRVLLLPEELYQYLTGHILQKYSPTPDEWGIASALWAALQRAKVVDYSKLGKAEIEKFGPGEASINLTSENDIGPHDDPPGPGMSA